jgi:hypothetical protein
MSMSQRPTTVTAWSGWIVFAGILIAIVGILQIALGTIALARDELFAVQPARLLVDAGWTTWGWVHLVLGILQIVVGVGLLVGQMWARATGVVLAVVSILVNIVFLAAFPVWSVIVLVFDVITIYAITAHGREVRRDFD